jgi:hypothetical protein
MEIFYLILTPLLVFTSLVGIWINLKKTLAPTRNWENVSKEKLLNCVIFYGLYTIWLSSITYLFLRECFQRYSNEGFYRLNCYLSVWAAAWAVEAFTDFLIRFRELMRRLRI